MKALNIGTAAGRPGELTYGDFEALSLPTGGKEAFPVIIAQGRREGPVLWITAGIHGDEYTGIQVTHRLMTPDLPAKLRGAVVAIPSLNPAGLRVGERTPYYMRRQDPNRLFPAPSKRGLTDGPGEVIAPLEMAYRRLFDHMQGTADYLIDLHNYQIGSIPFAFRDPVYYHDERDRPHAQRLYQKTGEMLTAFGMTVVNEYASPEYLRRSLHRSVSGAALHVGRIPAFTAELGGYLTVDRLIVSAAVRGLQNVMRWAGMLDSTPEPLHGIPVLSPGYAVRRMQHPHAPMSGIAEFLVSAGMYISTGTPVARMTDLHGRAVGPDDGLVRTAQAGYVLGVHQGTAFYEGDALLNLAVRDTTEGVLPYPI